MEMGLRVMPIGDFGNYGADIEAVQYLQSNEETHGYEEMQNQSDVAVFKVCAEDRILRDRKVVFREPLNNSKAKCRVIANRATVLRK